MVRFRPHVYFGYERRPDDPYRLLALLTLLLGNTFYARNIVASALMMIWATRLGGEPINKSEVPEPSLNSPHPIGFLLYRVLKRGSDARFDEIRSNFFKFLGEFHSDPLSPTASSGNLPVRRFLDW